VGQNQARHPGQIGRPEPTDDPRGPARPEAPPPVKARSSHPAIRAFALGAVLAASLAAGFAAPDDNCLACHADKNRKSAKGAPVFVDADRFKASVHGQAEIGCIGCHADLKEAKEFPHAAPLQPVKCAACHGTESGRLGTSVHFQLLRPENPITVSCVDCHGSHDIRAANDPTSSINPANLARTCGRCHPGAGANFAKVKIHVGSARAENRIGRAIRIAYIVIIAGLISVFLLFIAADLFHRMRTRWIKP